MHKHKYVTSCVRVCMFVFVCVCVCERERERKRELGKGRGREREEEKREQVKKRSTPFKHSFIGAFHSVGQAVPVLEVTVGHWSFSHQFWHVAYQNLI